MDYTKYIEIFNSGQDELLLQTFYHDDVVFEGSTRTMHGKQALREFLAWAHDGIREIIRAQVVLQDGNHIFAEVDMDFRATKDKPEFVFGALKNGEYLTVKFFVVYYLRDGKVAKLKSAIWPPNQGVTKPTPRLGGTLEQRQAFLDYAQAFSNAEYEKFSAYYADDVQCLIGKILLQGKQGILDFYRAMFPTVRERIEIHRFTADDHGIAAELTATFTAQHDVPDFVLGAMKKDEFIRGDYFVHYQLRDGKITNIRAVRAGELSAPQARGKAAG